MFRIEKIHPMFNQIITTMNMYGNDVKIGKIIDGRRVNTIKEYQTVIDIGPLVKEKGAIKPGDIVFINPKRFTEMNHNFSLKEEENVEKDNMHINFKIPIFSVYDNETKTSKKVLLISDNDIYFSAEGKEVPDSDDFYLPDKKVVS